MVYVKSRANTSTSGSEVDPTGSLWYSEDGGERADLRVLKLTPQGHYGILRWILLDRETVF